MISRNEIYNLLKNPDRENDKIEFKRSDLLRSNTGKIKIAEGIVAFANRYGGKLIFGIKDDGDFQGKSIFDIDNNKGTIEEICYKRISPVIDYDIEFFQYDEGDILVVDIPRKKNMPHAYIEERKGPDIKERTYYIRTNHGKRLLTDRQLQWLFQHQEEPDFVYPFRIVLSYLTDSLEFVDTFQIEHPNYVSYYWDFLNIPKNDREKLKENSQSKLASFFLEISPYAFLRSLLYFSDSWLININRHKVTPHSITLPKKVDKKIITINDIPLPQKNSTISSLSWDFMEILRQNFYSNFVIPPDTNIKIIFNEILEINKETIEKLRDKLSDKKLETLSHHWVEKNTICSREGLINWFKQHNSLVKAHSNTETIFEEHEIDLILDNALYKDSVTESRLSICNNDIDFVITFKYNMYTGGSGIERTHPYNAVFKCTNNDQSHKIYYHQEIKAEFKTSFKFFEKDIELFDDYYFYANTIKDILENEWNYDKFINTLAHPKLYGIDHKLKAIMKKLNI